MRTMALGLMLLGGAALAGCSPIPISGGYSQPTVVAPAAPAGFTGSTTFHCGGSLSLVIVGNGSTLTVTPTGLPTFTATGGPLRYASGRFLIVFDEGYATLSYTESPNVPPEPCRP